MLMKRNIQLEIRMRLPSRTEQVTRRTSHHTQTFDYEIFRAEESQSEVGHNLSIALKSIRTGLYIMTKSDDYY